MLIAAIIAATRKTLSNPAVEAVKKGDAAAKKEDFGLAIAEYTEAIRLDPKVAEAYALRGCAYNKKGEHDKAIADYSQAIRLAPNLAPVFLLAQANTYQLRGLAYVRKGELDKAIADYSEATGSSEIRLGLYWSGGCLLREG